jgi:hypothetical protein
MIKKQIFSLFVLLVISYSMLFPSLNIIYAQEKKALTLAHILEELRCGTKEMEPIEIKKFILTFGGDVNDYRCILPGYMINEIYQDIIKTITNAKESILANEKINKILEYINLLQDPIGYFLKQSGVQNINPLILPNSPTKESILNMDTANLITEINNFFNMFKCGTYPVPVKNLGKELSDIAVLDQIMLNYYCSLNFEDLKF